MQDSSSHAVSARPWLPEAALKREQGILASPAATGSGESVVARIEALIETNRTIHEHDCVNLNPATNVLNPRAEAALGGALGSRPSLGYPGMKYEMGLEAIEEIEVLAAALACRVFSADYAEIRVGSGALANLYSFMATCEPGDAIIVPPPTIGGHVTHNTAGAAGLFGLDIHEAPIDAERYTVDVDGVAALAERIKPKLITIGSSLNLVPHPVAELRAVADSVGAKLLCDAAHMSALFGGGMWPDPLAAGAHLMTMSTYKSLGGPAGGLLLTNDAELAEKVDAIAYPGLTANFDAGSRGSKSTALSSSAPPTERRPRINSRSTPASGAAAMRHRNDCARRTSWRAPSACRKTRARRQCRGSGSARRKQRAGVWVRKIWPSLQR